MDKTSRQRRGPNVVLILADDMGYSDVGCYGGEIETPNIDRMAAGGLRLSQFYNTARCSPSRASLLTGLHPHQTGIGVLTEDDRPNGYPGTLGTHCVTLAEVLRDAGYATYMTGKWHVTGSTMTVDDAWPTRRGFERFFGTPKGGGNYWWPTRLMDQETEVQPEDFDDFFYTDAIADRMVSFLEDHARSRSDDPFLAYVAFTAPHWPLHAREADIVQQRGRYDEGWDVMRTRRWERQKELGLFPPGFDPARRDPRVPAWDDVTDKGWHSRRMEVYAAQVAVMDAGIGRILDVLERIGVADDTVVLFLSDNGGSAEEPRPEWPWRQWGFRQETPAGIPVRHGNMPEIVPGPDDTFASYGREWAHVSNTPFREYKRWVHEGGIATPFVVWWPGGELEPGAIRHAPHQLTDVMATVLDLTGARYPRMFNGCEIDALEGVSMLGTWRGEPERHDRALFWEHEGNAACRRGRWKLVLTYPGPWELYDIDRDRAETRDRAAEYPGIVASLSGAYATWAERCGVIPRETELEAIATRRHRG